MQRDLRAYRRNGPDRTTEWLIDALRADGIAGMSVLDIGAGVGAVHHALLADGAAIAVDVEGSPAYAAAAREEAARRGLAERVRFEVGDFVDLAPRIERSDVVVLDRVICCYPDMDALVRLSAERAARRYGLVYPRDTWWVRAVFGVMNAGCRLFRQRTRAWIHRTADVEAILRAAGLRQRFGRSTLFWQVAVYERATPA